MDKYTKIVAFDVGTERPTTEFCEQLEAEVVRLEANTALKDAMEQSRAAQKVLLIEQQKHIDTANWAMEQQERADLRETEIADLREGIQTLCYFNDRSTLHILKLIADALDGTIEPYETVQRARVNWLRDFVNFAANLDVLIPKEAGIENPQK